MRILLIVYDNESHISYFPMGIAYIAAVLKHEGYEIEIYNQDIYHWPEEHLTDFLNKNHFDIVGLGAVGGYYQFKKVSKLSEAVNKAKKRPFFVLGGHLVSPDPAYFLKKMGADAIVIGEGEVTFIELIKAIAEKSTYRFIKGIAFKDDSGNLIKNPKRDLISNIDEIPFPAWDLFPMDHYALFREANIKKQDRFMTVLSGRGCKFHCNFCYRMDEGFRPRSVKSIIEEIKILQKDYDISYIDFADELFMSSKERVFELCEGFLSAGLRFTWRCSGRLNFAQPDTLKVMEQSGCVFINYGIESLDDKALRRMNKALTAEIITKGIENTLNAGISPGYNIIFGNIGESQNSLNKGVEFLLKYDDHSQFRTIRPVTPYPGSPLFEYAVEKGLIEDCQDFYENKHTNSDLMTANFTDMSDEEYYEALFCANKRLIDNYFSFLNNSYINQARRLYFEKDTNFRGFRQS